MGWSVAARQGLLRTGLVAALAATPGLADAAPTAPGALLGSQWRLVSLQQTRDHRAAAARPSAEALYQLQLQPDGRVSMRVNCNRANGRWSAQAGRVVAHGRFSFGPLASTRAFCPPPNLDAALLEQLRTTRAYRLSPIGHSGKRSLSLISDGAISIWERQ